MTGLPVKEADVEWKKSPEDIVIEKSESPKPKVAPTEEMERGVEEEEPSEAGKWEIRAIR